MVTTVTARGSRLRLALTSLLVLLHAAAATSLRVSAPAEPLGDFDVLRDIQTEVDTLNGHLEDLSEAIDNAMTTTLAPSTTAPTGEPTSHTSTTTLAPPTITEKTTTPTTTETTTTSTTTETTTPTTTETTTTPTTTETTTTPTTTETTTTETTTSPITTDTTTTSTATTDPDSQNLKIINSKQPQLFISRDLLSVRLDNSDCDAYKDIEDTLTNAQEALDLVSQKQLDNETLEALETSNTALNFTVVCVNQGDIKPDNATVVQSLISDTEESGQAASDTINNIVDPTVPPTSPPEDDSGFRAATIALGVLFALSLVAVAGLSIYTHRQKSGGHMS